MRRLKNTMVLSVLGLMIAVSGQIAYADCCVSCCLGLVNTCARHYPSDPGSECHCDCDCLFGASCWYA